MAAFHYQGEQMDVHEMVEALEGDENVLSIQQDGDELESMTAVYDSFVYRIEADEDGFTGYNIVDVDLGAGADIAARVGWGLANLKKMVRGEGRDEYGLRPSDIEYSIDVQDLERTYPGADLTAHPERVYQDPAGTFHADGDADGRVVFEDEDLHEELEQLGLH